MKTDITVLTEFDPALFSHHEAPLVSLYMTTHRHAPDNQQDPIRYKNLATEVKNLLELNYDRMEYGGILDALRSLEEHRDSPVWRNAKDGLAVLADNEGAALYQLDYPVDEFVSVTGSYHIKPLIRNFQYGSHYHLLDLTSDGFTLYHGDFHSLEPVELPEGVKSDFRDAFDDYNKALSGVNSISGSPDPYRFGYGEKSEIVDKETVEHFRYVNKTLEESFPEIDRCPFIVVSLPQHQAAFRSVATIPTLLEQGIDKPFESMSEDEVRAAAVAIIESIQEARIQDRIDRFGHGLAHGQASADPREIAHALAERKVETLFVEQDRLIPGTFDAETGSLSYGADMLDASDDLTDDFAQATYLQGGDVFVLAGDRMPSETGVAALYRY